MRCAANKSASPSGHEGRFRKGAPFFVAGHFAYDGPMDPATVDYYQQHATGDDPFNWIKGHPLMTAEIISKYPFDHAGIGETSLMLALCPEAVVMARIDDAKWYTRSAREGTAELGWKGVTMIEEHLREVLGPG